MAKLFRPDVWEKTAPLIEFMFGRNKSREKKWADKYVNKIYEKIKNYQYFTNK